MKKNVTKGKKALATIICAAITTSMLTVPVAAEPEDNVVIGMVVRDIDSPFMQGLVKGVQDGCDEYGYELNVQDGKGDNLTILEMIDTYIMQEVDAFIMCGTNDQAGVVPGIEKLNEAGIPVYALDSCPTGGEIESFISFSNVKMSEKATEAFIEGIKDRNGGEVPEGVVIDIMGALTDVITSMMNEGFHNVIDQYPQIEVAAAEGKWTNEDAYERTSELLARYEGQVLGIYCESPDLMGTGCVRAVETAGLKPEDFGICGIHIGPEFLEMLQEGKALAAIEFPGVANGELTVDFIHDKLNGIPYPEIGDILGEEGDIWYPAEVKDLSEEIEGAAGLYVEMNGCLVPAEVSADDERLWENAIY